MNNRKMDAVLASDLSLQTILKVETWRNYFSPQIILEALQSKKLVLLFLDNHDSDFESYLVEILKTQKKSLAYYANYIPLKKTQITFAQTLLSLLFLSSKNIQTNKSFGLDVFETVRRAFYSMDYLSVNQYVSVGVRSLFKVFQTFLFGNNEERSAIIDFLKCMKCHYYHNRLFKSFGTLQDLSDQKDTTKFFSNILACFDLDQKNGMIEKRKTIICLGSIPRPEIHSNFLTQSGLLEMSESISRALPNYELKLCLVSNSRLSDYDWDRREFNTANIQTNISSFIEIIQIQPISEFSEIEKLVPKIIKALETIQIHRNSGESISISNLIPDNIVEEFSKTLFLENGTRIRVVNIASSLCALIGVALQKHPKPIDSSDIQALFTEKFL